MRNTAIVCIALFALCLLSCSHDNSAMTAAEKYYQCLIDTDYNAWIDGTLHSETFTPEIRQERIDMLRQYLQDEELARNGIKSAKALRDTVVEENAYVFLDLAYGDSTHEEVLLPMVKVGEVWKMK